MTRRSLLAFAVLFALFSLAIVVTGGFVTTVAGTRLSSRSPIPAAVLALTLVASWAVLAHRKRAVAADLAAVDASLIRRTRVLVAGIAAAGAITAAVFHTYSATGADASGYLSYADTLARGQLTREERLAAIAKWPDGPATLAPLGWRASADGGHQVPTYAVGFPALLAIPKVLLRGDDRVVMAIVPLTFGVAIVAAAALAAHAGGPSAALVAAVWLATSPIALVESMQVMSDVPVTAAWLAGWWLLARGRFAGAGVAVALAVLIRPNLAPLAALPLLYVASQTRRYQPLLRFGLPVVAAGACIALLQWTYFGSPLRSGYGSASEIYALANVAPNAALYLEWLLDTHGPWLLAAPLACLVARRDVAWWLVFAAGVIASYLVYAVFESWTYLRFMLPALAMAMIAVAALVARIIARMPAPLRAPVCIAVVLAISATNLLAARSHDVFRVAERQARGRLVGERLAATLPVNTVIVTGEHSGTMRYYTGYSIVRWDLITPTAMEEALQWLRLNGYQLWVVLDDWEEEAFRKKLPAIASLSIDYAPAIESAPGVGIRTRAWRVRRIID